MVKKFISIIATLIFTACLFAVISPSPASADPGWWDISWTCRKSITITELSGSALTDYQVKIDLSYEPAMQADFRDVRFIDSDNATLLPHWCESYVPSTSATFWVKVPSLPASSLVTISMYYGNPAASSTLDGWNTFEFFDDFSAGLGQWTIDTENTDTVYISASAGNPSPSLRHDPDSSQTKNSYFDTRLITNNYKMLDGIIEYEVYLAGTQRIIHQLGWRVQSLNFENGYCWRLQTAAADGGHLRFTGKASWSPFGTPFNSVSADTWHSIKEVVSGSTYTGYVDGGSAYSGTDSIKQTEDYLVSHVHGVSLNASSYVLVDNIRVRKYANPEPSCSTGVEEVLIPPAVTSYDAGNIDIDAARLNGTLDDLGTATSADVSFEWDVNPGAPYSNETTPETLNATGNFSFDLSSLTPNTTYYFRAKAVGLGTGYGAEKSVTTLTLPTVITSDAGNIGIDAAQLNGSLDDFGTATSADISFEWSVTSGSPYANETTPETVNVTGNFSFDLSSLTPNTTYYFRAKAVGDGTSYGIEKSFTTLTLPTVTTKDAGNIGIDTAQLNGTLDDLGTAASADVSFEWGVTPGGPYPNETTPETVNVTGTFWFDLSPLTQSTTYYFRVKAVGDGTGYGVEKSFTTNTYYVEYVDTPHVYYLDINALGLEKSFNIDSTGKLLEKIDITCSDGTINIYIAKGTIVRDEHGKPLRTLEICAAESPSGLPGGTCQLGSACTFLPGGTTFDPPMTITWRYDPDTLSYEINEEELFMAYFDESIGRWISLDGVVDILNKTITAEVSHFTTFALLGIESKPASFTVYNLMITPATVNPDENITVSVSVANTGDFTGSYNVAFEIDDEVIDTKQVILPGGESEAIVFELSKDIIGSHSVDVNGLSGSFVVEAVEVKLAGIKTVQQTTSSSAPTSPEPSTVSNSTTPKDYRWLLISSITLALLLGLVLYFLVIRPRMV